ncbi:hypothetical protein [Caminibacter mediatlanticus]|uniref:Uncharacterized protein n=1 Tax=Caminibacter mediatlanticus TB-2 TaxID=391592 RepID=A0AAI9F1P1_9BACT|nr:hypothetical protein [Caminibacter mediatlanticus]EDM23912.1 hypothetical protein CMTB2_06651 [Caminibacter mediatlanticus TB-2]
MKLFDRIDEYFYSKSKKEFIYTILLFIILVAFIIYYFIYPIAQQYYKKQESQFHSLTTKLNNLKITNNVLQARINLLNKKIKQQTLELATLSKKKMFYNELANLLDFAEFDQYKWAKLVKDTVNDAKAKGMLVTNVENKIYDVNITNNNKQTNKLPKIIKRMDIGIELEGKYKNFIYYLYNYENRKELIRVKEMKITSPSTFYVKFSVYGYDR